MRLIPSIGRCRGVYSSRRWVTLYSFAGMRAGRGTTAESTAQELVETGDIVNMVVPKNLTGPTYSLGFIAF